MKTIGDHKIVLAPMLFSLAVAFAPAAQAKNSLRCTVVDEAGNPVAKQEVQLTLTQTGKEWKRRTNNDGEVEFKGLDDGAYQVEGVQLEGYLAAKSDPIELSGDTEKSCQQTFYTVNYFVRLQEDALQAVRERKHDLAVEKGKLAVRLNPEAASAHYILSVGYAGKGMGTEAVEEVNKAAELDAANFEKFVTPIHLAALQAQADQAMSQRDFDGAIQKYEAMLVVSPQEANAYYGMALVYGHKGEFQEALKSIDKAIELGPTVADFRQIKATLQRQYLESMDKKLEIKK